VAETYPFDPQFERTIIAMLVSSDRFYNLVGPHLEPDRFKEPKAQLVAAECRALYETLGKAPGSLSIVLQRIRALHNRGKINAVKMGAVVDYLCDALDAGLPDPDVAVHEVSVVLKRIKHQAALDGAFTTFAERGDMQAVAKEISSVENIGKNDVSYGVSLDGFAEELDNLGQEERMSTGFRDLDVEMGGGTARGEFWFWLARAKVGKSMALVQNAAIMMLRGLHVAVATLELDAVKWRARVLGTLTGTPYQDILRFGSKSVAFDRYQSMLDDPDFTMGLLTVHKFAGHQTPLSVVTDWVKREEDRKKRQVEGLVIDYDDKLTGPDPKASMYDQMRDVFEGHRIWCADNKVWGWSASQAQRLAMGELPTINNCADSDHKVRVCDGMIGITRLPDDENKVRAKILALRNGTGDGAEAGPLPNGFDYGCFVQNCAVGVEEEKALIEGGKDGDGQDLGIFA